jgi:hypothetical protein
VRTRGPGAAPEQQQLGAGDEHDDDGDGRLAAQFLGGDELFLVDAERVAASAAEDAQLAAANAAIDELEMDEEAAEAEEVTQ